MKIYVMGLLFLMLFSLCKIANAQLAVTDPVTDPIIFLDIPLQLEKLTKEAADINTELNALKALGNGQYQWSNVSGVINNLGNLIQQKNALAYSAANADAQFKQQFPGYAPSQNFTQQYQDNVATTMATLDGVLQSLGSSAKDFTDEPARVQFLQSQVASAQGQTQAIQASAQISTEIISQIQLLRQTVMTQTNAQTAYYAQQLQTQATAQKNLDNVVKSGSTNVPQYGGSGNSIYVPDF